MGVRDGFVYKPNVVRRQQSARVSRLCIGQLSYPGRERLHIIASAVGRGEKAAIESCRTAVSRNISTGGNMLR